MLPAKMIKDWTSGALRGPPRWNVLLMRVAMVKVSLITAIKTVRQHHRKTVVEKDYIHELTNMYHSKQINFPVKKNIVWNLNYSEVSKAMASTCFLLFSFRVVWSGRSFRKLHGMMKTSNYFSWYVKETVQIMKQHYKAALELLLGMFSPQSVVCKVLIFHKLSTLIKDTAKFELRMCGES